MCYGYCIHDPMINLDLKINPIAKRFHSVAELLSDDQLLQLIDCEYICIVKTIENRNLNTMTMAKVSVKKVAKKTAAKPAAAKPAKKTATKKASLSIDKVMEQVLDKLSKMGRYSRFDPTQT